MPSDAVFRLRYSVHSFLMTGPLSSVRRGQSVLEIGPMHAGSCPVPGAFVDVRAGIESLGASYCSCDPDPAAGATYTADFLDAGVFTAGEQFDHIIACEVFEHVPNIWAAPARIRSLLRAGGTLWCSTPFMFEQHGPSPDCWRFCEAGIRHLWGHDFDLTIMQSEPGPSPIHFCFKGVLR